MTGHVVRLYVAAVTIVVFFLLWALVAAHPWAETAASAPDPRTTALDAREQRLRLKAARVKRVVDRRWGAYERRLARRNAAIAAAEQRHLRELEAAYAAAVHAVQVANARAAEARAYAATILALEHEQRMSPARATTTGGARPGRDSGAGTRAGVPISRSDAVAAPAEAPAPPPRPAEPPPVVQVVTQPPVTKTRSSK